MRKYLTIAVAGQSNIGVLQFNASNIVLDDDNTVLSKDATERLKKALGEHFDEPVKIIKSKFIESNSPLTIEAYAVIGEGEGDAYNETVKLTETWLY